MLVLLIPQNDSVPLARRFRPTSICVATGFLGVKRCHAGVYARSQICGEDSMGDLMGGAYARAYFGRPVRGRSDLAMLHAVFAR